MIDAPITRKLSSADLVHLGTLGLRSRPARTTLSCLGIAIGVAAMVAVVGISGSSRANLVAQLDNLGTGLLTVQPGQSIGGDQAVLPATAPAMTRRIEGIERVTTTGAVNASIYRTDLVPAVESGGVDIRTAHPDLLAALSGRLAGGTFLTSATVHYPAVVLGSVSAQQLGIDSVLPRQRVWIGGHWFAVVGILEPLALAPELDTSALVGIPIARRLLGFDGSIGTLYLRARPSVIPQVRNLLPQTVSPAHPEEVQVSRPSEVLAARTATNHAFTALLLGLGAVALIVGGIGIANVMVIAVLERRSEIGLRRALGATRRQIAAQFVTEAFLLSALGGLAGVLLGQIATVAYATSHSWGLTLPLYAGVGGLAGATFTGVVAGSYPAIRAARLAPTDALRAA